MIGTIVKPNVGLQEDEFRHVVRELARASIDLIKDDELMTDPGYLPLERRVAIATEEIRAAEQVTGHPTMYAFNITGDLAGLRRRHDLVVEAGGRCVMLNVPVMGLPGARLAALVRRGSDPRPPRRARRLHAGQGPGRRLPRLAAARPPRRRRPPARQRPGQQVLRDRRRGRGERPEPARTARRDHHPGAHPVVRTERHHPRPDLRRGGVHRPADARRRRRRRAPRRARRRRAEPARRLGRSRRRRATGARPPAAGQTRATLRSCTPCRSSAARDGRPSVSSPTT